MDNCFLLDESSMWLEFSSVIFYCWMLIILTRLLLKKKKKLNWERKNIQYYLDWGTTVQNSTRKNIIFCQEPTTPHFTSLLRTYLTQYPNQYIYINLLITTIKKNKIISLIFNVKLNIFTNILHINSHIFSFIS